MWEFSGLDGDNIYKKETRYAPLDQEFDSTFSTAPEVRCLFDDKCKPSRSWGPNSQDPAKQFCVSREKWMPSITQPF